MLSKKTRLYAVLLTMIAIVGVNFFSKEEAASAVSVYDDVYHKTDSVKVSYPSEPLCSNINITGNWTDYITDSSNWANPGDASNPSSAMSQARASFLAAVSDDDYGTWSVSQVYGNNGTVNVSNVLIAWSVYPGTYLQWQTYGLILKPLVNHVTIRCEDQIGDSTSALKPVTSFPSLNQSGRGIAEPVDGSYRLDNLFIHSNNSSFSPNYPAGYEGETLALSGESSDFDGDGLTMNQEMSLGTLYNKADTDGDGISDLKESIFFGERGDVFCDDVNPTQCVEPDPLAKDIFVEIDWMNDGVTEYKPTDTQLGLVEDMFAEKGINIHFDTGQYGGGQQLSTYTASLKKTVTPGQVDYWDYVNGGDGITLSFGDDRHSIWRYMIYGNEYPEKQGSTGWAEVMGDNLFIAGGVIENAQGLASLDRAVAGTIAHELGHNLCLSDEQVFEEQPLECVFGSIDNGDDNEDYASVMNYRYQLTDNEDLGVVDYSDGSNGAEDHDDWSAVLNGMGGFSGTRTALGTILATKSISPDGDVIVEEKPISEMREEKPRSNQNLVVPENNSGSSEAKGPSQLKEQDPDPVNEKEGAGGNSQSNSWMVPVAGLFVFISIGVAASWVWGVSHKR